MGSTRDIDRLWARYLARPEQAPTTNRGELEYWRERWGWEARLWRRMDRVLKKLAPEETERLLAISGRELYVQAWKQLREEIEQGRVQPALLQLLMQSRQSLLRGLRLPERITRQEQTGADGEAVRLEATHSGQAFDFDALAALWRELSEASSSAGAADTPASGSSAPESLDPAHADRAPDALPDAADR